MGRMKRILLLGASGQVGFALHRSLAPLGELAVATRRGQTAAGVDCLRVDLADPASLIAVCNAVRPDCIVNAAAYTAVDQAEREPQLAARINGEAVGELGAWAAERNADVVHYSTDYVFAGNLDRANAEDDPVAPLGVYGRSKRAGEVALENSGARHLILRTAWVYAARGKNFLRTMLRLGAERDALRVVDDQIGSPTPAVWIAAATAALLARRDAMPESARDQASGIYHLVAAGQCSWFAFAQAIFERAHALHLLDKVPRVEPIASSEYPTPAARPAWSVLETSRLARDYGLRLPAWQDGLDVVMADIAANGDLPC